MTEATFDVAVVGLGPVGSALTTMLARAGVRVLAVDRDPEIFGLPRAAHIDHMGLRTMQSVGILDQLLPDMIPNPGLNFVTSDQQVLMRIPGDQSSISGLPASMYFHQPRLDRALRTAAMTSAAEVRLGVEYVGHETADDSVVIKLRDPETGPASVRARWLVGCDGSWSPVREQSDIALEDLRFDEPWLVVDLLLQQDASSLGLPKHAVHVCDPTRPHTAIPMPGRRYRFELQLRADEDPDTIQRPESVANLLHDWLPPEAAEVERAAVYTFHGLVAETWRAGRVFIAGDAAHQMPPFLGQGMCSGFRDATNLAWKLIHVLRRGAREELLDTYELERRPHVRSIVEAVIAFGSVICDRDPAAAHDRDARFLADPRPPEQRVPFRLPRLGSGPLVFAGGGSLMLQPTSRAADGARFDDVIGDRFFVLAADRDALRRVETWWHDNTGALVATVDDFPGWREELCTWLRRIGTDLVVVRPDRYVMATAEDLAEITDDVVELVAG